jgi:hypothetical protein
LAKSGGVNGFNLGVGRRHGDGHRGSIQSNNAPTSRQTEIVAVIDDDVILVYRMRRGS